MTDQGHKVASLTGAFEGSQRDVIIDAFRTSQAKVLITTNVLARGIDVQSVSMVVNYVRNSSCTDLMGEDANTRSRTSLKPLAEKLIRKPISIVSVALAASVVLASPLASSMTRGAGKCSRLSRSTFNAR